MTEKTVSKSIANRLEPNLFRRQPLADEVMREFRDLLEAKIISSNTRPVVSFHGFKVNEGVGYEGDLIACKAKTDRGAHSEVEDWDGKLVKVSKGDLIVGVLSNRESSRFLVGYVPKSGIKIKKGLELDLLARGGNIGICESYPESMGPPLKLEAIGLLSRNGKNVNIADYAITSKNEKFNVPLVMVVGTSAECGKTTTSSKLIYTLTMKYEDRVAATKITGTGRLGDTLKMYDAGGAPAVDFVDAGLPSTYTSSIKVVDSAKRIFGFVEERKPTLTVAEFGGDVIWGGVPAVLSQREIRNGVTVVVVCASDAVGAYGAVRYLNEELKYDTPIFISGPVTDTTAGHKRLKEVTGKESFNVLKNEELVLLAKRVHELAKS